MANNLFMSKEEVELKYCEELLRGAGTFGEVKTHCVKKEFENTNLRKRIVVKSFKGFHSSSASREINNLRTLLNEHHIVKMLGYNEFPFFIYMECLNDDLSSYSQKRNFNFSEKDLFKVCMDTLRGLISLQKFQIIHRDIKPKNLLVDFNGSDGLDLLYCLIKICDLGASRPVNRDLMERGKHGELTKDIGTPGYMCPEVTALLGDTDCSGLYTFKADIWSLAVSLLYLCTGGKKPFTEAFLKMLKAEVNTDERRDKDIVSMVESMVQEENIPQLLYLMKLMLKWNENDRISADACLKMAECLQTKELAAAPAKGPIKRKLKDDGAIPFGAHPYIKIGNVKPSGGDKPKNVSSVSSGVKKTAFDPEEEVKKYKKKKMEELEKHFVKLGPEDTHTLCYQYSPSESYVNRTMTKQKYEISKSQDNFAISGYFKLARASQYASEETTPEKIWDNDRTRVTESNLWQKHDIAKYMTEYSGGIFLLRAAAGVGKTAFTEFVMYKFCAETGENKFWGQFTLVLLLPCRAIIGLGNQHIGEVIMAICFPHLKGSEREAMFAFLERLAKSMKLCLLFDGVDELNKESTIVKDLVQHPSLGKAHVLVTGRPDSIQDIIKYLQRGIRAPDLQARQKKPFTVVDLMGLKSNQIKVYFHKVHCQQVQCKQQCQTLYDKIKNNLMLRNLTSIPVYASMFYLCEKNFGDKFPVNLVTLFVQFFIGQVRDHGIGINSDDIEVWFGDLARKHPDIIEMFRSLAELAFKCLRNESFEKLSGTSEMSENSTDDRQLIIEEVHFPSRNLLNKIGFFWTEIYGTGKVTGHFVHLQWLEFLASLHILINGLEYPDNKERQRFFLAFGCGLISPQNEFANNLLNVLIKKSDPITSGPTRPTPDELINHYLDNMKKSTACSSQHEGLFRGGKHILSSFDCATMAMAVHEAQTIVSLTSIPNLQDCTIKLEGKTKYNNMELQALLYLVATHGTELYIDQAEIKGGSCHTLEMIGLLGLWIQNQQLTPQIKLEHLVVSCCSEGVDERVAEGLKLVNNVSTIKVDVLKIKGGSSFILENASRWTTSQIQIGILEGYGLEDGVNQTDAEGLRRVIHVSTLKFNARTSSRPGDLSPTVHHLSSLATSTCKDIYMEEIILGKFHSEILKSVGKSFDIHKVQTLRLSRSDLRQVETETLSLAVPAVKSVDLSGAKLTCCQLTSVLAAIPTINHPFILNRLYLWYLDLTEVEPSVLSRGVAAVEKVGLERTTMTDAQVIDMLQYVTNNNSQINKIRLNDAKVDSNWQDNTIKQLISQCKKKITIEGK